MYPLIIYFRHQQYQKSLQQRPHVHDDTPPRTHPAVEAPLCAHCNRLDVAFFDPSCSGCWGLLRRSDTTPSHLFAVLRQWVPQVQRAVHLLVNMASYYN